MKLFTLTTLALAVGLCHAPHAGAADAAAPNIILILTDDQGWNSLSIPADPDIPGSGSTYYQTPNTTKLAEDGIRFSMAYSAAPTCGPSRHSIQYGQSPTTMGKFAEANPIHLPAATDALASRLKAACPEYRAAHFGKWHQVRKPADVGYDADDGPNGNLKVSPDPRDPKFTFSLEKKANAYIEKQTQAGHPFFMQVSFYADHLNYEALPETVKKYEGMADQAMQYQKSPLWAAMNEDMDTAVGSILGKLDELGIADNTYVIYTADNGYECKKDLGKPVAKRSFYKGYPLVSHKYMISEGGLRVPFLVRGPGIPAGAFSREPVVGWDIFPTVLDMAGAAGQVPEGVEGESLLPLCKSGGKGKVERNDPFMVFRYAKRHGALDVAIVQDGYKLLREIKTGQEHLWSLWDDLGEQNNLLEKMPERAGQMRQNMDAYFARRQWDQREHVNHVKRKGKNQQLKKMVPGGE